MSRVQGLLGGTLLAALAATSGLMALGGRGSGYSSPRTVPTPEPFPASKSADEWRLIQDSTSAFAAACKDQWFLSRENGEVIAVEHRTAELVEGKPENDWVFVTESWAKDDDKVVCARYRLLSKQDAGLTPVEGKLEVLREGASIGKVAWKYEGTRVSRRVIEAGQFPPFDRPVTDGDGWEAVATDGPIRKSLVVDWSLHRVLERATIAGISRVECSLLLFVTNGWRVYEATYVAGSLGIRSGHTCRTWRQENRTGPYDADEEIDISPEEGLVARHGMNSMNGWLGRHVTSLLVATEEECRATGLVPP